MCAAARRSNLTPHPVVIARSERGDFVCGLRQINLTERGEFVLNVHGPSNKIQIKRFQYNKLSIYRVYLRIIAYILNMATFILPTSSSIRVKKEDETITVVKKEYFNKFNEDILGLGNIESKSKQVDAISVYFDLEGFTNFCNHRDPKLKVPEFLSAFLKWLFQQIRLETIEKEYEEGFKTYSNLPFLSKYLGDGVLFLWDTAYMNNTNIRNVVISMHEICEKYVSEFIPNISKGILFVPPILRCGIAVGAIYSVGNGNDFVGPCINLSARLQKLNNLTFAFTRQGIDPSKMAAEVKTHFIVKKVNIRGIGDELICILKSEYLKLAKEDKDKFMEV